MPKGARHVAIGYGKAVSEAQLKVDVREVDGVPDVAGAQEVPQLLGRHDRAVLFGLDCAGPEMRRGVGVAMHGKLCAGKVGKVCRKRSISQRGPDSVFVNDFLAREVEQYSPRSEGAQRVGIDQALRRRQRRDVYGHVVRLTEQAPGIFHALYFARQAPGRVDGKGRVVSDHAHAKVESGARNLRADSSQTEDAQRSGEQFSALETSLLALHQVVQRVVVGDVRQGLHVVHPADHIAGAEQESGERQLLDRVCVGAGRIEDDHSLFCASADRNVVDAGAGARDRPQARAEVGARQDVAAQENRIRGDDIRADPERIDWKQFQSARGDLVVGLDSVHGGGAGKRSL